MNTHTNNSTTEQCDIPYVLGVDAMTSWLTAQQDLTAETFATAVGRVGSIHGPWMLVQAVMAGVFGSTEGFLWHSPAMKELAKAVALTWSGCENPSKLLSDGDWRALFGIAGYTMDGIYAGQTERDLRLYRGAPASAKYGMSWTSDLSTARRFAAGRSKLSGDGKVWTAVFDPEYLLAHITLRGESEYVVDPEAFEPGCSAVAAKEYVITETCGKMASGFEYDGAPHTLLEASQAGAISTADLAAALYYTWAYECAPSTMLSLEQWRPLFAKAGYTQNGVVAGRPTKPLRLYRGAPTEGRLGMSWTDDPSTAERFSRGSIDGDGKIWTAVFNPEYLLAHITLRGESEYVVDPEALVSGLVRIEEYIPA